MIKKLLFTVAFLSILISCSKQEDFTTTDDQQVAQLENGLVFRKASLKNQEITFSLFDNDGNEITENVVYYVDETALSENTFQSDADGEFEIYAEFVQNGATVVTETETFRVISPAKKPVVEDYTGTWCGNCPSVTASIDEILSQTDNVSVVAIHNGDSLSLDFEQTLRDALGVPQGSPRARIDRTTTWGSINNYPIEEVLGLVDTPSNVAISINSFVSNGNLSVTVTVASEDELANRKLVLYLVEDGIISSQKNYFNNDENSPYFGMGDPIENFVHNHTLRASLSNIVGDEIPNTPALTDYKANFSYDLPNHFVVENLHLVAMVVDMDNNGINSQHALVGDDKSFE